MMILAMLPAALAVATAIGFTVRAVTRPTRITPKR